MRKEREVEPTVNSHVIEAFHLFWGSTCGPIERF